MKKENETADTFIEKLTSEIGKNYAVRVASSDGLIRLSSFRSGVLRMTASELEHEVESVNENMHELIETMKKSNVKVKMDIPGGIADALEDT